MRTTASISTAPFLSGKGRGWPVAYFSVQVKSNMEPWKFETPESVQWVVEYPAPLLLCIIDKSEARVRIYQTMASRFGAAIAAELPVRMTLVPGSSGNGSTFGFDGATGNYNWGHRSWISKSAIS